ncbi:MAG: YlxR family protein [Deltaproteobacteria bacterium]|nr:YlxR family protein [Deltaproteobacteria bacterium]
MSKSLQLRTCLGCGQRAPQPELVRLAAMPDGAIAADWRHRQPGRGGYLHQERSCWERFAARKGPVRSLQRSMSRAERQLLVARLRADSEL